MDISGKCVLVEGAFKTNSIKANRLKLFFARKERGGPIDKVEFISTTSAIITFKDHEDAAKVVETTDFNVSKIDVKAKWYEGTPEEDFHSANEESNEQSDDQGEGAVDKEVEERPKEREEPDGTDSNAMGGTSEIDNEKEHQKVNARPLCQEGQEHLVQIIGINASISEGRLKSYFSNRKRGGPISSAIIGETTETAIIEFKEYQDAERVVQVKQFVINEVPISACWLSYEPQSQTPSESTFADDHNSNESDGRFSDEDEFMGMPERDNPPTVHETALRRKINREMERRKDVSKGNRDNSPQQLSPRKVEQVVGQDVTEDASTQSALDIKIQDESDENAKTAVHPESNKLQKDKDEVDLLVEQDDSESDSDDEQDDNGVKLVDHSQMLLLEELPLKSQHGVYMYRSVVGISHAPVDGIILNTEKNSVAIRLKHPRDAYKLSQSTVSPVAMQNAPTTVKDTRQEASNNTRTELLIEGIHGPTVSEDLVLTFTSGQLKLPLFKLQLSIQQKFAMVCYKRKTDKLDIQSQSGHRSERLKVTLQKNSEQFRDSKRDDKLVIVTGVPEKITEQKLKTFFSKQKRGGPISTLTVQREQNLAFVNFCTMDDAERAVKLSPHTMKSNKATLKVSWYDPGPKYTLQERSVLIQGLKPDSTADTLDEILESLIITAKADIQDKTLHGGYASVVFEDGTVAEKLISRGHCLVNNMLLCFMTKSQAFIDQIMKTQRQLITPPMMQQPSYAPRFGAPPPPPAPGPPPPPGVPPAPGPAPPPPPSFQARKREDAPKPVESTPTSGNFLDELNQWCKKGVKGVLGLKKKKKPASDDTKKSESTEGQKDPSEVASKEEEKDNTRELDVTPETSEKQPSTTEASDSQPTNENSGADAMTDNNASDASSPEDAPPKTSTHCTENNAMESSENEADNNKSQSRETSPEKLQDETKEVSLEEITLQESSDNPRSGGSPPSGENNDMPDGGTTGAQADMENEDVGKSSVGDGNTLTVYMKSTEMKFDKSTDKDSSNPKD